jgi:hypothetical protein
MQRKAAHVAIATAFDTLAVVIAAKAAIQSPHVPLGNTGVFSTSSLDCGLRRNDRAMVSSRMVEMEVGLCQKRREISSH